MEFMVETDKKAFAEVLTYKDAVLKRSQILLDTAQIQDASLSKFSQKVDASKKRLKDDLALMKSEVESLKREVAHTKLVILQSISQMRYSVKKDELAKIEKRSEAWNPEGLADRKDLKKFT
jgi:hypothetical protein